MSILSKIQSLISAANSATGESDTTLTDAVQTLVDGYGQGGGEEWFMSPVNGAYYTKKVQQTLTNFNTRYYGSLRWGHMPELEEIEIIGFTGLAGGQNAPLFEDNPKLTKISLPSMTASSSILYESGTSVKEITFGSIGHAVTTLSNLTFRYMTQNDLTITLYVADDATLPLANSPWGATNATIIYRSATTGEVITV